MFYGFDLTTNRCVFTASGEVTPPANTRVVEGDWGDEIHTLEYVQLDEQTFTVRVREPSEAELITEAVAKRYNALQWASEQIAILKDVIEFSTTTDPVKENLFNALRKYRVDVFNLDTTKPREILWPEPPVI